LYTFVLQLLFVTQTFCQTFETDSLVIDSTILKLDSTIVENDSSKIIDKAFAFDTVDINIKDDDINSPVHYKALDSIVYDVENKMLYLYGNGEMKYDKIQVNSENIEFDWNTQTLTAEGVDSADKKVGTPILVQDGKTFEAKKMEYNFRTSKGKIYEVVTEDNGAFIHSEIVQKRKDNSWLSYNTKYTTCNDKEHPHFYIQAKKAKIIPDKVMVSGPANLIISGINTPLVLPFAIFPVKSGRRSGIIMPQIDFDYNNGIFGIRGAGYYWAVNDFLSLSLKGGIWTDGTFDLSLDSRYKVRYKSDGNIGITYRRRPNADIIRDGNNTKHDYSLNWSHRMSSKADPNNQFSANVNVRSSSYAQNAVINTNEVLEVVNNSNITYTRRFNGKPYNLTISGKHSQSNITNDFSITLPEVAFSINKITPFKPKVSSKKKKFYERIGFTYNIRGKAFVSAVDSTFFTEETLDEVKFGINQNLRVDANYSLFKYFTLTPSINYTEQWMFKKENIEFNEHYIQVNDSTIDTIFTKSTFEDGFYARRNFNTGISLQTKLTGIYGFRKGAVKAIRHIITPRISYTYKPDFSAPIWNYFGTYLNNDLGENVEYNQFANTGIYGTPGKGEQNGINFSLGNTFDMKVLNKKDTAISYKKIPLLKSLAISSGYNFAGDSISKFQDVTITASTSFLNNLFGLRGTLRYNPYSVNYENKRISATYMETHQKPLRFVSLNFNVDFNLRAKTKKDKKKQIFENEYGTVQEQEYIANNPSMYYDFDIPWSFYASYQLFLTNGSGSIRDTTVLGIGNISFGGDINITPKWKINLVSGYNIRDNDLVRTSLKLIRDLHCWEMSLDWVAYPIRSQSFTFELRVKSALLQDLKLTRKQNVRYDSSF